MSEKGVLHLANALKVNQVSSTMLADRMSSTWSLYADTQNADTKRKPFW